MAVLPELFLWLLDLAEESPRVLCAAEHRSEKMAKLSRLGFGTGKGPEQVSVAKLLRGQNNNTYIELNFQERARIRSPEELGRAFSR